MEKANAVASLVYDETAGAYQCIGAWSIQRMPQIQQQIEKILTTRHKALKEELIKIDGQQITFFDSAAALSLINFKNALLEQSKQVKLTHFTKQQNALLKLVEKKNLPIEQIEDKAIEELPLLARLGKETLSKLKQVDGFIILVGDLSVRLFRAFGFPRSFQFPGIVSNIYSAGIQALPIVGLLAFLIGVVLAYQMGIQLQTYGATSYIAYLSGLAIFREFGPLITAIIVAGRTSSAFTAQIGNMKINEEVDALETMGLSPTEYLVVPKVLGLLLIFPLLIFWADAFSVCGALLMSKWMLNVSYADFLIRLKTSVHLDQFLLGLYKAPAFAILTSLVGCFQGFQVKSATIGSQTTKSVVQALFLIIVADATYSIIYSWLDL